MKVIMFTVMFALSLKPQVVFAHGEDKPGPNGGFIRMPGAFHTEVVLINSSSVKIYLLDINWQNPTVRDSSLKVTHKESKISKVCDVKDNYYICKFPKSINLRNKGELLVEAKREGQKGVVVSYELPLTLQKINNGHDGHHM